MKRPTAICITIYDTDISDFDKKVSMELNDKRWDRFYYVIEFRQDEHLFYAHIIFTELANFVSLDEDDDV